MTPQSRLRDPLAIARNWGSAKDGTHHFTIQRLTAVALMLLSPWFVWFALGHAVADHASARAALAAPLNATLMLAFVVALFWHVKLGLQVVVEDYVHVEWQAMTLQILITFACFAAVLAAVLAIGRIAFAA